MSKIKRFVVFMPDIDYRSIVSEEILQATWVIIHRYFVHLRYGGNGFLSSLNLKENIGEDYKRIIDQLVSGGLFKVERNYSAGSHCREYRFLPAFKDFCFKTVTDEKLVKAYVKHKRGRKYPIHKWLDDILGNSALVYDYDGAVEQLEKLTEDEFRVLNEKCTYEEYKETLRYAFYRASNLRLLYCHSRSELSSVDGFGFRYHHPITCLHKSYRKFLTWNGEILVNLDISNSQPLFLALAYAQTNQLKDDWITYKAMCEKGILYESLNENNIARDTFKEQFFRHILFGGVTMMERSPFARQFKQAYPSVYEFIRSMKTPSPSRQLKGEDKARPHRLASKALQRAESKFMFQQVIPELRNKEIIPAITVHDPIMTVEKHSHEVSTIIKEQFRAVGFECSIKIERYSNQDV